VSAEHTHGAPANGHGFASGKLILCGEHAVVHGHPAIAFAVDRGTDVHLQRRPGALTIDSPFDDDLLRRALTTLLGDDGFAVRLRSTLPVGRGMGSSASLAVALVRARRSVAPSDADEFDEAMAVERVFHANPSGVDVAVSSRGGVLRYVRSAPTAPPQLTVLPCPTWSAVVIDSGKAGYTAGLVAGVASRRPGIDGLLERIGALVDEASAVLRDPASLGPLLTENHRLLAGIGVSTDEVDGLVDLALRNGAHGAKLSGAGGGGVVLALHDDPDRLVAAARHRGYEAWPVRPLGDAA
jgi:mevalonate kinase